MIITHYTILYLLHNLIIMIIKKIKSFNYLLKTLKHNIAIETMKTPNPNFLKFIPINSTVLG